MPALLNISSSGSTLLGLPCQVVREEDLYGAIDYYIDPALEKGKACFVIIGEPHKVLVEDDEILGFFITRSQLDLLRVKPERAIEAWMEQLHSSLPGTLESLEQYECVYLERSGKIVAALVSPQWLLVNLFSIELTCKDRKAA